jgi:RNA polymerase sigma-70 factor (ECF subfamily)
VHGDFAFGRLGPSSILAFVSRRSARNIRGDASFRTTQWGIVIAASAPKTEVARAALTVLCDTYWYPLYAYIRRRGYPVEEAEDLTQAFFAKLLEEKATFKRADPERGKFRSYLLGALGHFLSDEMDKERALKRGGGKRVVKLDVGGAEGRLEKEAVHSRSPEWHFDREWGLTVLQLGLDRLKLRYAAEGKEELFEQLHPYLSRDASPPAHRELASALKMTDGATKVALHRLRKRYGECVRKEIARTLGASAGVEDEVRHLFDVLRS